MHAEFDIVLGLEWMAEVRPIPDWNTFDWYVSNEMGTLRIAHCSGARVPKQQPKLLALQINIEQQFDCISAKETKKILQKGGCGVVYYVRMSLETDSSSSG